MFVMEKLQWNNIYKLGEYEVQCDFKPSQSFYHKQVSNPWNRSNIAYTTHVHSATNMGEAALR